jgi:hypothetical protein
MDEFLGKGCIWLKVSSALWQRVKAKKSFQRKTQGGIARY